MIKQVEELIFHWGLEGYGAEIYRITENSKVRFLKRYSSKDMNENDDKIKRHGEVEYKSFEKYWEEFTSVEQWLLTTRSSYIMIINSSFENFLLQFLKIP